MLIIGQEEDKQEGSRELAMRRRRTGMGTFWLVLLLLNQLMAENVANALECIQCDRQALWYSPEENERHIARCQRGLIPPSRCTNRTHSHCIYSYYRQGGVMTVTERRCGTAEEISGCTLYKSMHRVRRHFVAGSGTDVQPSIGGAPISHRRRETGPLVVEVCTGGCQKDGCVSAGGGRRGGNAGGGIFWTALACCWALAMACRGWRTVGAG